MARPVDTHNSAEAVAVFIVLAVTGSSPWPLVPSQVVDADCPPVAISSRGLAQSDTGPPADFASPMTSPTAAGSQQLF
jgi:hypothetical protein